MAVNIGPRIGIDGEAEYRKQIQDIIQTQKTLKSEMQAVSSAWDKSTSAEKKNKQQKEILNKQIENQNKRVEELTKMLDASTAAYGENDIRTQKWRQAVNEATAELNGLKKELEDIPNNLEVMAKRMESAGDTIQSVGSSVTDMGGKITTHVTAPIMAVGAAAMAAWNEVDGGLDTIIKKTGASGEALAGMEEVMKDITATIPVGFDAAANAVGEVNTRFGSTGEELETLSTAFLRFAELNGTDVSGSIDRVQAAMEAFGLKSTDAVNVLDILNKAGQDTGVSVDKLSQDLLTNATALQEMGFNINQSVGFLAKLNKSGIDSSAVMTGMKKALQEATKDGVPLQEALAQLQDKMQNAKSSTEAMQLAMDLFGNKAGPQLAAAIQEGTLSFDTLSNAMIGWAGSVETTFNDTLDPVDQFQMSFNELKVVGADLATILMEMAVPAIQKISEVVSQAKGYFDGLDEGQKQNIVTIAGIVAAVGPVVAVLGKVITTVGTIISIGGKVAAVIAGLNPVVLAIGAAIAGVVAVGVTLYKNWDTVIEKATEMKEKLGEIWENIKTTISSAIDKVKGMMNFEWKFPDLKLPHFSIEGGFSLNPPSVPHLSIDWYAKAMDKGVILNRPTIFGMQNGRLLGGGEVGAEVVVGANSLAELVAGAVSSAMGNSTNNYGGNTINVYGAPGQNIQQLAREISNIINGDVSRRGAVWA
jgi:phage-related minor tail protein